MKAYGAADIVMLSAAQRFQFQARYVSIPLVGGHTTVMLCKFDYNSNSNKFALSQYEKDIEIILIEKVIEEVIRYLSKF